MDRKKNLLVLTLTSLCLTIRQRTDGNYLCHQRPLACKIPVLYATNKKVAVSVTFSLTKRLPLLTMVNLLKGNTLLLLHQLYPTAMRYLLFFLVIAFLSGCSSPVGYAVNGMSKKVSRCCVALAKGQTTLPPNPEAAKPAPFPSAVFEKMNQLVPTW